MENCLHASSVRVALAAGAFGVFDETSAAWPDGWQAASDARLSPVIKVLQYVDLMMRSVEGEMLRMGRGIAERTVGRNRTTKLRRMR